MQCFVVARESRLDQAIAAGLPNVSRREAKRLLDAGRVVVDGVATGGASRIMRPGARISIVEENPQIDVLKLSPDLIAIDKPAGLASQPEKNHEQPSLQDLASSFLKQRGDNPQLFVVHRIDQITSGVIVYARTRESAASLSRAFRDNEVEKHYVAIVYGRIDGELKIDAPITQGPDNSFTVGEGGKSAFTQVRPLRTSANASLVDVAITTGRTHQIRVHLSHIGHPIVGDRKYGGGDEAPRAMLHCRQLAHSSFGAIEAGPPEDFLSVAAALGL